MDANDPHYPSQLRHELLVLAERARREPAGSLAYQLATKIFELDQHLSWNDAEGRDLPHAWQHQKPE